MLEMMLPFYVIILVFAYSKDCGNENDSGCRSAVCEHDDDFEKSKLPV